jgi:hypothetical protein
MDDGYAEHYIGYTTLYQSMLLVCVTVAFSSNEHTMANP